METSQKTFLGLVGVVVFVLIVVLSTLFGTQLRTAVVSPLTALHEEIYNGTLLGTNLQNGNYTLSFEGKTQSGSVLTGSTSFSIVDPSPVDNGGGDSGNNGGSGNGGKDSRGSSASGGSPARVARVYTFQAEKAQKFTGRYSQIVKDGLATVAKLAGTSNILEQTVSVPLGTYWLEMLAKDDRPGPVDLEVSLNGTPWQVVRLDKSNNKYRIVRIGLLPNTRKLTIRFRFLNDAFNPRQPTNEDMDRNVFLDWWRLVEKIGGSTNVRQPTYGATLLPGLNDIIRTTLGPQFVTADIWQYYAGRLNAPLSSPATIQDIQKLRDVMNYWKSARPTRPRGD